MTPNRLSAPVPDVFIFICTSTDTIKAIRLLLAFLSCQLFSWGQQDGVFLSSVKWPVETLKSRYLRIRETTYHNIFDCDRTTRRYRSLTKAYSHFFAWRKSWQQILFFVASLSLWMQLVKLWHLNKWHPVSPSRSASSVVFFILLASSGQMDLVVTSRIAHSWEYVSQKTFAEMEESKTSA